MKMLKVLVAALLVAAMVTPAIAEDRLSLSGEMRVRAWHVDEDGEDYTDTWADQRLRLGGKISVAEGVSITFRTDITESTWGNEAGANGFGSGRAGSDQQWDRAHIDLTKGDLHLRAGQQLVIYGQNQVVDSQDNGLSFDVNGAVPVNAFFLVDNNGTTIGETLTLPADFGMEDMEIDEDGNLVISNFETGTASEGSDDAFVYGVSVRPTANTQVFVAGLSDDDTDVYAVGVNGSFDIDAIKIAGEIDAFFGDVSDTVDAEGLQGMIDISTALDAATVGIQGYYAAGTDKADEEQVTVLGNGFNGWDPIMDVGTGLSNEAITFGNPFDFTGESAGVVGARIYASTKAGAADLGVSAAYLETEEDDAADVDGYALAAGVVYPVMDNTTFQVQLQYTDFDEEGAADDEEIFSAGTGLFVAF